MPDGNFPRSFLHPRLQKSLQILAFTLTIFTAFRILLYLIHSNQFREVKGLTLLQAFADGLRFDLAAIAWVYSVPLLIILSPLPPPPWVYSLTVHITYLVTVLIAFVLASDLIYFGYVGRHLGDEILFIRNDLDFIASLVIKQYGIYLCLFVCGSILFWILWWRWFRVANLAKETAKKQILPFLSFILVLFLMGRGTLTGKPMTIVDAFRCGDVACGNLSLNGVFSLVHSLLHSSLPLASISFSDTEALKIINPKGKTLSPHYPLYRYYETPPLIPGKPNLIFILVESLSSRYMDSFSYRNYGVTPHLDELARLGIRFTHFYAAGQRSIQAIQTILTGVPVLPGIPELNFGLEMTHLTPLGFLAQTQGYHTLFLQSSRRRSFRLDSVARITGFFEYYGMEDYPQVLTYPDSPPKFGWDCEPIAFLRSRLESLQEPFLIFFFTGTTHGPFPRLPAQFMRYPYEPEGEGGYLNTLFYFDTCFGELLEFARKRPWFSRTLWVITGDHPPQFPQPGTTESLLDRFGVPLIIAGPSLTPQENSKLGSHRDLLPTLVDLLWNPLPFAASGESLFQGGRGFVIVHAGAYLGLIAPQGYMTHSLENPLGLFLNPPYDQGSPAPWKEEWSRKLLSEYQLVRSLIRGNRWAMERN